MKSRAKLLFKGRRKILRITYYKPCIPNGAEKRNYNRGSKIFERNVDLTTTLQKNRSHDGNWREGTRSRAKLLSKDDRKIPWIVINILQHTKRRWAKERNYNRGSKIFQRIVELTTVLQKYRARDGKWHEGMRSRAKLLLRDHRKIPQVTYYSSYTPNEDRGVKSAAICRIEEKQRDSLEARA